MNPSTVSVMNWENCECLVGGYLYQYSWNCIFPSSILQTLWRCSSKISTKSPAPALGMMTLIKRKSDPRAFRSLGGGCVDSKGGCMQRGSYLGTSEGGGVFLPPREELRIFSVMREIKLDQTRLNKSWISDDTLPRHGSLIWDSFQWGLGMGMRNVAFHIKLGPLIEFMPLPPPQGTELCKQCIFRLIFPSLWWMAGGKSRGRCFLGLCSGVCENLFFNIKLCFVIRQKFRNKTNR